MCALETFKDIFFPSQNFLNFPSVFVQQCFTICFHIHLIKAELNSCDIQANKVLNFCKCFLSEKRWKKRQSSNILRQNSTTHCWHVESFGVRIIPWALQSLLEYKFFQGKGSFSLTFVSAAGQLWAWNVCMLLCMYVYVLCTYVTGMLVFRYVVPKMKKMCINVCWNNLKTDFKTPENDLSHFKNVFAELGRFTNFNTFLPVNGHFLWQGHF